MVALAKESGRRYPHYISAQIELLETISSYHCRVLGCFLHTMASSHTPDS